jgi:hypothetical protein
VASKLQQDLSLEDLTDRLDTVDKTLDRLKTLYEQYFLGIQKQAPAFIHNDVERKLRDLQQMQIRNTGLRYRLATLQQKFGSYNSYWRRTMRQIENGKYLRNLSKIGREAARTGAEIPEEILAAMPKRMREQVIRDREQALAIAARRRFEASEADEVEVSDLPPEASDELIAMIKEPTDIRRSLKTRSGAHIVDESDGEIDIDAFFAQVEAEPEPPEPPSPVRFAPPATPPQATRASGSQPAIDDSDDTHPTGRLAPVQRQTGPVPAQRQTGPVPAQRQTGPVPAQRQTGPVPAQRQTGPVPAQRQTGPVPAQRQTGPVPV